MRSPAPLLTGWDHRVVQDADAVVSSLALAGPAIPLGYRLSLRWHGAGRRDIDASATPFLPILSLLGSVLGADVDLHARVDPIALTGARRSIALLASGYRRPEVRISGATTPAPARLLSRLGRRPARRAPGLFFSRGVDSFSTLVAHRDEIGHLLGVDWVDLPYASDAQRTIWQATENAAAEEGLPLVRLTTNAREVLDPLMGWDDAHGGVLIGLALLSSPRCSEIWISSAHERETAPAAHGNNRELVESWSTGRTTVRQMAAADSRTEKARVMAYDPVAVRWLKVCWEAPGEGNCGRCEKCLRTMCNFAAVDALPAVAPRFREPLSVSAIRALDMSHLGQGSLVLLRGELAHFPADLRAAWEDALERSGH